jgi:hypothetical protein
LIENDTDCAPVKSSEKSELTGQRKGNTRPRVTRKAKSLNLGLNFVIRLSRLSSTFRPGIGGVMPFRLTSRDMRKILGFGQDVLSCDREDELRRMSLDRMMEMFGADQEIFS